MQAAKAPLCIAFLAAAMLGLPASGQTFQTQSSLALTSQSAQPQDSLLGRTYLGINVGRARNTTVCATSSFLCDDSNRSTQLYAGTMIGNFWGAEVGFLNSGRLMRDGIEGRAQGLNLSLIGRTRLGSSLGLFGKVGTTYSRTDTSIIGASTIPFAADQGFGLSYGGGVSYDFTPRLTGRIEWDSHDLRFNGSREPVRSTNLGLQFKY